jgi:hypothetical protein
LINPHFRFRFKQAIMVLAGATPAGRGGGNADDIRSEE